MIDTLAIVVLLAQSIPFPGPGGTSNSSDTTAVTSQSLGTLRNNFSGCVGFEFTPGSNITVTQLGRWIISGNTLVRHLLITDTSGNGLGSCDVDTSLGTPATYQFCTPGSPISLSSGTAYRVVSQEFNGEDQWYDADTTITATATITLNSAAYSSGFFGDTCLIPATTGSSGATFVPTNFKYH